MVRNSTFSLPTIAGYVLAALLLAMAVHHGLIARMTIDEPGRIGVPLASPRTDINDSFVYFSLIKRGPDACQRQPASVETNDASGNILACTYVSGLVVTDIPWIAAQWLSASPRWALALLMILQTAGVAFAAIVALHAIAGKALRLPGALAAGAAFLLLIDNFSVSFYLRTLNLAFAQLWSVEPNVVRLFNPTTFWTLGLAATAAIVVCLDRRNNWVTAGAAVLTLLASSANIAIGAALGMGIGGALFLKLVIRRSVDYRLALLLGAAFLGVAWQYLEFRNYWTSELGKQLNHGIPSSFRFNPAFLVLLLPVLIGRIGPRQGSAQYFLKSLLIGSALVGALCDSVELGSRLWLRGTVAFAFICCAGWVAHHAGYALRWIARQWLPLAASARRIVNSRPYVAGTFASALVLVAFLAVMVTIKPSDPQKWNGFIDRDKDEVLTWLAARTLAGDTVASANLEDSFLIDLYTPATPFVSLYGMTSLPWEETVRRYFHAVQLLRNGAEILDRTLRLDESEISDFYKVTFGEVIRPYDYDKFQEVIFYTHINYYRYNLTAKDIFSDGKITARFREWFTKLYQESGSRRYAFKFLLLRSSDGLAEPSRFKEMFRNGSYVVFQPTTLDTG